MSSNNDHSNSDNFSCDAGKGIRLLIVANVLPVTRSGDEYIFDYCKLAGIVPAVQSLKDNKDINEFLFFGAVHNKPTPDLRHLSCVPITIPPELNDPYYYGYCKSCLWPLLHYRLSSVRHNLKWYDAYVRANELFAEVILEQCRPGDLIWIHDYHLFMLPSLLRARLPRGVPIGFFFHVPFPTSELFRILPNRKEILEGILGADMIGFQSFEYVRHFQSTVSRLVGVEGCYRGIESPFDGGHFVRFGVFPAGIDPHIYIDCVAKRTVQERIAQLRALFLGKYVLVCHDRVDEIEGVPLKLQAFEAFFKEYPDRRGLGKYLFDFLGIVEAPDAEVESEEQHLLQKTVNEMVGRINGQHATVDYMPIEYSCKKPSFEELCALYSVADVALVTPIRDGMNLASHDYVVCQGDNGVLILSEFTGAARCLSGARLVNPFDNHDMADAIAEALRMGEEDVNVLRDAYNSTTKRVFLLDYDGTLSPLTSHPKIALPSSDLLRILEGLSKDPNNSVYVISSRDTSSLMKWLGHLHVGLSAEHGAFLKEIHRNDWEELVPKGDMLWREAILPIMEDFTERTPGSYIEIKQINVTWHYRNCDPEYGTFQARELMAQLQTIVNKYPVEIIVGKKTLEAKPVGIVQNIMRRHKDAEYVFCVGDDKNDEDMFLAASEVKGNCFTCRVMADARCPTQAKFWIETPSDLLDILSELAISAMKQVSRQEESRRSLEGADSALAVAQVGLLGPLVSRPFRRNSLLVYGSNEGKKISGPLSRSKRAPSKAK